MNDRCLYNVQKSIIEEIKQELLKKAETERQKNVIKEVWLQENTDLMI